MMIIVQQKVCLYSFVSRHYKPIYNRTICGCVRSSGLTLVLSRTSVGLGRLTWTVPGPCLCLCRVLEEPSGTSKLTADLATFPRCVMFLLCFSFAMRILCLATILSPSRGCLREVRWVFSWFWSICGLLSASVQWFLHGLPDWKNPKLVYVPKSRSATLTPPPQEQLPSV